MSDGIIENGQCLEKARRLVCLLEDGRHEEAEEVLNELTHIHESSLFQELGRLTRELHDALNGLQIDSRMSELMEHDLPDAKERLDYVIQTTERAAHKTLTAVEESIPLCDDLMNATRGIHDRWRRFLARDMTAEQFREMAQDVGSFLDESMVRVSTLRDRLNEILIAQDYQDLTGQTIRRVIKMVQDVEDNLVNFIRLSSRRQDREAAPAGASAKGGLQGPQIPGREDSDAMKSQDEVDALLSGLGF